MTITKLLRRTSLAGAFKYAILIFIKRLFYPNLKISFSEFAEDINILNHFKWVNNGIYIDVGANHPINNSVTFLLYIKGWSGICIDGNSDHIGLYKKYRPKDIALTELISNENAEVEYIKYRHDKLNTIVQDSIQDWNKELITSREIRRTRHLADVLHDVWPDGKDIDLLSVDTEGADLKVLQSHDFAKFPVKYIVVEMHGFNMHMLEENLIYNYLHEKGYILDSFSGLNGYFKLRDR